MEDPEILAVLERISHISQAGRAWKSHVNDVFDSEGLFSISAAVRKPWKHLLSTLLSTEKDRVIELLGTYELCFSNLSGR